MSVMTKWMAGLVVGAVACAGCGPEPEPVPEPEPEPEPEPQVRAWDGELQTYGGEWVVRYDVEPSTVPLNEVFGLDVQVVEAAGGVPAGEGVSLAVDARMPHHRHGMTRVPLLEPGSDGTWRVDGMLLHMPGYWELHFDVVEEGVAARRQAEMEID